MTTVKERGGRPAVVNNTPANLNQSSHDTISTPAYVIRLGICEKLRDTLARKHVEIPFNALLPEIDTDASLQHATSLEAAWTWPSPLDPGPVGLQPICESHMPHNHEAQFSGMNMPHDAMNILAYTALGYLSMHTLGGHTATYCLYTATVTCSVVRVKKQTVITQKRRHATHRETDVHPVHHGFETCLL